jgi:hypothetical protein
MLIPLLLTSLLAGFALEFSGALFHWPWAETLVAAGIFGIYAFLLWRPPVIDGQAVSRTMLVVCILLATAGELVMSAGFRFYLYRQSVLPVFVPPGHVLLFLTGLSIARAHWYRRWMAFGLVELVLAVLLVQWIRGHDFLSFFFLLVFLPSLRWGRDRDLYAVMFLLALMLELLGTALGTWRWQPFIVGFGWELRSANPPLAAGAGYAALDLATMLVTLFIGKLRFGSRKLV